MPFGLGGVEEILRGAYNGHTIEVKGMTEMDSLRC
jgi:hypothetical protein